jgi:hypothetical protein
MLQFLRRVSWPLILMLALTGCGAGSGLSSDDFNATRAAALTEIELTAEYTPLPSASPSPTPTEEIGATLSPTASSLRTATRPATSAGPLCDDAAYVSDVTIPDGTKMDPEEAFIKTWKIRNTGACTWTTEYGLDYSSGEKMDGVVTYLSETVEPGGEVDISIGLVAPAAPGTYTGYWRMKNADGAFFGEIIYVQIVVPGSATATATSETPVNTVPTEPETEATDTPIPTNTETPLPTAAEG